MNRVALVLDSRINSVLDLIAPCPGDRYWFWTELWQSTCGYNYQNMLYDGLNICMVAICHSFRFICMDDMDWNRLEFGLKQAGRWFVVHEVTCLFNVKVSRGITQCHPQDSNQCSIIRSSNGPLNVRQTVHILLHDSPVKGTLPVGEI